jgi:hypothetical protein
MDIPWESINGFAGSTGIGAICILGFFFIADGKDSNILNTLNSYVSTAAWGILAAIPTIAISFLAGQFAIFLGTFLASLFNSNTFDPISSILIISKSQNDFLSQEYLRIRQEKEILCGSAFSFLILGVGSFFEIRNLISHKAVVIICANVSLVVGIALFIFGVQRMYLIDQLMYNVSQNIDSLRK